MAVSSVSYYTKNSSRVGTMWHNRPTVANMVCSKKTFVMCENKWHPSFCVFQAAPESWKVPRGGSFVSGANGQAQRRSSRAFRGSQPPAW